MTETQARHVFRMARMEYANRRNAYESGDSNGFNLQSDYDALRALSEDFSARFSVSADDGYFRMPRQ